ncbi:response regulator transcription factor [Streptomyces endophyticus]|uniref:Response regulator transcription factor n=1 Tax=Streptomyces endophyticus TaxID=714166 RepID=A0ABU6EZI4_9ACTN|nr:response regulator transcription factor [Streptomyces endophyticus]MEB8337173.1 response regulator transcription factor [Streptomyces endophyticus]
MQASHGGSRGRALPLLLVAVAPDVPLAWLDELDDPRFSYHRAYNGHDTLRDLYRYQPDLLILGLRVRDPGPWEVLRRVREMTEDLRVMVATRRFDGADALRALDSGADDVLWHGMPEGLAKALVMARLRRATPVSPPDQLLEDGRLRLDLDTHEVTMGGQYVPLTPLEFDLLHFLARNPGQVLSPEQLLHHAWRARPEGDAGKVKYAVLRLRRSIERATGVKAPIETVRGVGYRYVLPGSHPA